MHKQNAIPKIKPIRSHVTLCSSIVLFAKQISSFHQENDNHLKTFIWSDRFMETNVTIILKYYDAPEIKQHLECHIMHLEEIFSPSLAHSQLSRLNHTAVLINPDSLLVELLEKSREIYFKTGGAFNVLCSPASLSYMQSSNDNQNTQSRKTKERITHHDYPYHLYISNKKIMLRDNFRINLNHIIKGFVIDSMSAYLIRNGFRAGFIEITNHLAIGENKKETSCRYLSYDNFEKKLQQTSLYTFKANATINPLSMVCDSLDMKRGRDKSYPLCVTAHNATLASSLSYALFNASPLQRKIILENYKNIDTTQQYNTSNIVN